MKKLPVQSSSVCLITHCAKSVVRMASKQSVGIGIFILLICVLLYVILIPYFIGNDDVQDFNPLEDILNDTFSRIEEYIIKNNATYKNTTNDERDQAIKSYVASIKTFFPKILTIAMIGFVTYCISIILMMIGSLKEKIRGLMLPYIFLQCLMGINLFVFSIVLNLTLIMLDHPGWELLLFFGLVTFLAVVAFKFLVDLNPCLVCCCSITYLVLLLVVSVSDIVATLSFFTTFYLPLPLIWSLLEGKKAYALLGKTTGVSNETKDEKKTK